MRRIVLGVIGAAIVVAIGVYLWRSFDRAPPRASSNQPRDAHVVAP